MSGRTLVLVACLGSACGRVRFEQLGVAGGGPLIAWVRVPSIAGTSTTLSIDYGHGTPPPASMQSVWSDAYLGVWHLADLRDATGHHHDGSWLGGAMSSIAGMAGPTLRFVGSASDAITIADDASLAFSQALTISGWIDPVTLADPSGYAAILARQNGGGVNDDFWLGVDNPSTFANSVISVQAGNQIGMAAHVVPLDQWSQLAMTYDGTSERLYADGLQVAITAVAGSLHRSTHPIYIGADDNSGSTVPDSDFIDGALDEVRLEALARTPAWIAYDNLSVRDQLITYGPVSR